MILGVLLISQLGTINNNAQTVSGTDLPAAVRIGDISTALNDYESGRASPASSSRARPTAPRSSAPYSRTHNSSTVGCAAAAAYLAPGKDTADYQSVRSAWAAFVKANAALLGPNI